MKRGLFRVFEIALFPTIAFVAILLTLPDRRELALHVWLLIVLGASLFAALEAIRIAHSPAPSLFDTPAGWAHPDDPTGRFPSLLRLEREVSMATQSAYDVHVRLRPTLREVASGLLAARRGIDLDRAPARARAVLGEETWELVRQDREAPSDRRAAGLDAAALERVLVSLERL